MGYLGKVLRWRSAMLVLAMAWCGPAAADSWLPPRTETYWSPSRTARLTITPRSIKDRLSYYQDKVDGKEPAGQRPGGPAAPIGLLERCDAAEHCVRIWERPLVNELAPVSALLDDTGDHVVTFDNWGSVGQGPNVVVIYGPDGALVRSMSLSDILPQGYIEALPRTVSSVWWSGERELVGPDLMLRIKGPGEALPSPTAFEVKVDLVNGRVQPPSGPAFDAAVASAAAVVAKARTDEAEWRAWATEPLVAPSSVDEGKWRRYLTEADFRLAPDWGETYPAVTVLRLPTAVNYGDSVGWLREAMRDPDALPGQVLVFGSPDQDNLVAVLAAIASGGARGLKGMRVYVAVDDARWPKVKSALAGSRAELIQLNPRRPIPQRPERLPRRAAE